MKTNTGPGDFPDMLKRARIQRGVDHRTVAEMCGVGIHEVKGWEAGDVVPSKPRFSRLCNMLHSGLRACRPELEVRWRGQADASIDGGSTPYDDQTPVAVIPEPPPPEPPSPADAATFGEALRRLIAWEGISQHDLGELVGVTESAVAQWVRGVTDPIVTHYAQLLELFPLLAGCVRPDALDIPKPAGRTEAVVGTFGGIPIVHSVELSALDAAGVRFARARRDRMLAERQVAEVEAALTRAKKVLAGARADEDTAADAIKEAIAEGDGS